VAITVNTEVSIEFDLKDNKTQELIDSNKGQEVMKFVTGKNEIIPKLESKIRSMNVGDAAQVLVESTEAFGAYDETAVQVHPREKFDGMNPEVGMPILGHDENGNQYSATIIDITDKEVKVDLNHPLAGKDLLFDFKILDAQLMPELPKTGGGCGPSCGCGK